MAQPPPTALHTTEAELATMDVHQHRAPKPGEQLMPGALEVLPFQEGGKSLTLMRFDHKVAKGVVATHLAGAIIDLYPRLPQLLNQHSHAS